MTASEKSRFVFKFKQESIDQCGTAPARKRREGKAAWTRDMPKPRFKQEGLGCNWELPHHAELREQAEQNGEKWAKKWLKGGLAPRWGSGLSARQRGSAEVLLNVISSDHKRVNH